MSKTSEDAVAHGLVLSDPQPCDFIPVVGALGYFKWKSADASILPPPARWMLQESAAWALPLAALTEGDTN